MSFKSCDHPGKKPRKASNQCSSQPLATVLKSERMNYEARSETQLAADSGGSALSG